MLKYFIRQCLVTNSVASLYLLVLFHGIGGDWVQLCSYLVMVVVCRTWCYDEGYFCTGFIDSYFFSDKTSHVLLPLIFYINVNHYWTHYVPTCVNPNWHELWKQEKCISWAPHMEHFYMTQWAWQSVKITQLMSIFTSKKNKSIPLMPWTVRWFK